MKILVTSSSGPLVDELVHTLQDRGQEIIGTDLIPSDLMEAGVCFFSSPKKTIKKIYGKRIKLGASR